MEDVGICRPMETQGLCGEIADTKKELREEFELRFLGSQINIQTTKTLVETTQRGLEARVAEVTGNFVQGLDLTQCEFKTQLKKVEA
jgi:hypothetical protein